MRKPSPVRFHPFLTAIWLILCWCTNAQETSMNAVSVKRNEEYAKQVEDLAGSETAKSNQTERDIARKALRLAAESLACRKFENAFAAYCTAVETIPDNPEFATLRDTALEGFTEAAMGLAEQCITDGKYEAAQSTLEILLRPQFRPQHKPALEFLARLRSEDRFNSHPTPTPPQDREIR